jgi:hypothetical protein
MVRLICAVVTLALWSAQAALAVTPTLVTGLELHDGDPQTVRVSMSRKPESLRTFLLREPARLVLDIAPARLGDNTPLLPADHDLIHGVRIGQFSAQTVRVVFDLKQDVTHRMEFHPKAANRDSAKVMVSLFAAIPVGPTSIKSPDTRTANTEQPLADPSLAPPVAVVLPETEPHAAAVFMPVASTPDASDPGADKKVFVFGQAADREETQETARPFGTLDLSGFLMGKVAQELHESGNSGQERLLRNKVRVEGKWTPPVASDNSGATDAGDTYLLTSAQSDYLWFGPDNSMDDYDLDLFEAYLHHASSDWDLRLGRQIVRWGKADQISPVDNLNPQDLREFVIPELEDRKIPNWMARLRLFPGDVTLEGVFIPFFEENEFDWSGNTWALLGVDSGGLKISEDKPDQGLDNADWGLRASSTLAGWDLSLSYLQATEKSPRLRFEPADPMGPTLHADYARQHIIGWEFETTVDKFGFRGEGAYFDEQSLPTTNMNTVSKPMSHSVIGVDYLGEQDWYVNVQLSHQHIFDHEKDILFLREDNFYLSGEINKEFWRGNTMLKLRYAMDLHDGGSFFTPEAILTYFKNLELTLGANVFFGPKDSYFGRYGDNDQTFFKAVYRF